MRTFLKLALLIAYSSFYLASAWASDNEHLAYECYQQDPGNSECLGRFEAFSTESDINGYQRFQASLILSKLHRRQLKYDQAILTAEKVLQLAKSHNDLLLRLMATDNLATLYSLKGDAIKGSAILEELSRYYEQSGLKDSEAWQKIVDVGSKQFSSEVEQHVFKYQAYAALTGLSLRNNYENGVLAEKFIALQQTEAEAANFPLNHVLVTAGLIQDHLFQPEEAERLYDLALKDLDQFPHYSYIDKAAIVLPIGLHYFGRGDADKARLYLKQALQYQQAEKPRMETVFVQAAYWLKEISMVEKRPYPDLSKKLVMWNKDSKEIVVYIEKPQDNPAWRSEYNQYVQDAFTEWNKSLGNRFTFRFTDQPEAYDVKVNWFLSSKKLAPIIGENSPWWSISTVAYEKIGENAYGPGMDANTGQAIMLLNDIRIYLQSRHGYNYDPRVIRHTILHEVGHCMGIRDHSPNPTDIMHAGGFNHLAPDHPSARDIKALKAIYDTKPTYTNRPDKKMSVMYAAALKRFGLIYSIDL